MWWMFRCAAIAVVGLFFSAWLQAEEPEDALERITATVIQETGFPDRALIDQRFVSWLATATLPAASGEQTEAGTCGVSAAACVLPIDNQDLAFPGIRDLTIKTRRDGKLNASFKVKWKKPERLPPHLRDVYELVAYDVYLIREDGQYERYRLNRRLNRNGNYKPPRSIKFRHRSAAEYTINVRALYDLIDVSVAQNIPGAALAGTDKTAVKAGLNPHSGGSGAGSGWNDPPVKGEVLVPVTVGELDEPGVDPVVDGDLFSCIQAQYDDTYLLEDLFTLSCIQAGIDDIEGLEHLGELRTLLLSNNDAQAAGANTFNDLSVLAGLPDLSSVDISRVATLSGSELLHAGDSLTVTAETLGILGGITSLPDLSGTAIFSLKLADNRISSLDGNMLPPNLVHLDLDGNLINNFSLQNATATVESLSLRRTNIQTIAQASSSLKSAVKYLSVDESPLSGTQDFSGFGGLCSLNMQNLSGLSALADGTGQTTLPPHLQFLYAAGNTGLTTVGNLGEYVGGNNYVQIELSGADQLICPELGRMHDYPANGNNPNCPYTEIVSYIEFDDCRPVSPELAVNSNAVTSDSVFQLSAPAFASSFFIGAVELQECSVNCGNPVNWQTASQQPAGFFAPWSLDLQRNQGSYQFRIQACSQASPTPTCSYSQALNVSVVEPDVITELEHIWIDQTNRLFKLAWRMPAILPNGIPPDYFRIRPGLTQPGSNQVVEDVAYSAAVGTRLWQSSGVGIDADNYLGAVYTVASCVGDTQDNFCGNEIAINLQTSTPGHDLADVSNLNYSWVDQANGTFSLSWQYDRDYLCSSTGRPAFFQITQAVGSTNVRDVPVSQTGCPSGSFSSGTPINNLAPGSSYLLRACKAANDCSSESLITLLGAPTDSGLPVPNWTEPGATVNVESDSRQFMLSWSVAGQDNAESVDYFKLAEQGPFASNVFYTEAAELPLQRYRGGDYTFSISACHRDRDNGDTCGVAQTQTKTASVNEPLVEMQPVVEVQPEWVIVDQTSNTIQLFWAYSANCAGYANEATRPDFYHLVYQGNTTLNPPGQNEMLDASNGDGDCLWASPVIPFANFFPDINGEYRWEVAACKNNGPCGTPLSIVVAIANPPAGEMPAQNYDLQTHYWDQGGPPADPPAVPGGPVDLKPGLWYDPVRTGTGWNFYWASELRYPSVHENFGETYDLLAIWYAHALLPVGVNGNLEWSPVWLYGQLKLASDPNDPILGEFYEGTLYYPNNIAAPDPNKPCDNEGQCAVGVVRVHFNQASNTQANVSVTINSANGLAGITSTDFELGYITEDNDLFGNCTNGLIENPHDHYSGFWWHRLSPTQIDNSFLTQSWIDSFLDSNFITTYDDVGHPVWVSAVNDPRADSTVCGDQDDVDAIQAGSSPILDVRFIKKGINPTLPAPDGYVLEANRENDIGDFQRIYSDTGSFADFRTMGVYANIPSYTIGGRSFSFSIGQSGNPEAMEKIANLHDIRYYVGDSQQENQTECEMDGSSGAAACHLRLNWFTDAEYPEITVFRRNTDTGSYTRVACAGGAVGCNAELYPSSVDYAYSINQQGTYQFELWKYPDQEIGTGTGAPDINREGNAMIAQSSPITVVDNLVNGDPAANLQPADLTATGVLQNHPGHDPTVGMLAGEGGTSGGAATYAIPINVPPGRSGMQPGVSLSYHSRAGNGAPGMGWSLSAGSAISRCPATAAQDGYTIGITFADTDRLCLDGQRLIRINSGEYWASGGEYRTEIDSFSRITMQGGSGADNSANNALSFKVEHANSQISYYGISVASRARARSGVDSRVSSWLLSRREDRSGNNIRYLYQQQGESADATATVQALALGEGETVLAAIAYTGSGTGLGNRRVEFNYASRCDSTGQCDMYESFVRGYRTEQTLRLSNIKTCVTDDAGSVCQAGEFIRDYALEHSTSAATGRLLLDSVQESAFDGAAWVDLPATTFSWGQSRPQYSFEQVKLNNQPIIGEDDFDYAVWHTGSTDKTPPAISTVGDIDGNGNRELLVTIDGDRYLIGVDAEGTELGRMRLQGILNGGLGLNGDFNNDGRTDFLGAMPNPANNNEIEFVVMQWKPTVLWSNCGGSCDIATLFDQRFTGVPAPTAIDDNGAAYLTTPPLVADFDGDSRNDILLRVVDPVSGDTSFRLYRDITATRAQVGNTSPMTLTPIDLVLPAELQSLASLQPQINDLDGDGRPDIMIQAQLYTVPERAGIVGVFFNNATNGSFNAGDFDYQALSSQGPQGDVNNNVGLKFDPTVTYYQQIDINADGLADIVFMPADGVSGFADDDPDLSWHYQINTGNRMTSGAMYADPQDTDSVTGLWRTQTVGGVNAATHPIYGGLIRPLDWNNDGRAGLAVPVRLSNIVCLTRVVSSQVTQLLCPAHPDLTDSGWIPTGGCAAPKNNTQECELYLAGLTIPDPSLYEMSILEFVYDPVSEKYTLDEIAFTESNLIGGETLQNGDDLFGDGVQDSYGRAGCVELSGSSPICIDSTVSGYPASMVALVDSNLAGRGGAGLARNYYRNRQLQGNTETLDLLLDVIDGFNRITSWEYAPLSSNAGRPVALPLYRVPDRSSGNSLFDIAPEDYFYFNSSMYVVSAMHLPNGVNDGFTSSYYGYEEAVYNNKGRGFMGFRKVQTIGAVNGIVDASDTWATTEFHQVFPLAGKMHTSEVRLASECTTQNQCIAPATIPLGSREITWDGSITTPGGAYFPQASDEIAYTYDLTTGALMNTTTVSGRQYDDYGNLTSEVSTSIDSGLLTTTTTVANTYVNDAASWWVNLMLNGKVTNRVTYATPPPGGQPADKTVTRIYEWDGTHRKPGCVYIVGEDTDDTMFNIECLATLTMTGYSSNATRTITQYDSYGNPTDSYVLGSGMPLSAQRHTQSDFSGSDGYFAVFVQNAQGHNTSLEYDFREGQVIKTTGPNGLITRMAYDPFGREIQTWYPVIDGIGFADVSVGGVTQHYAPRSSTAYAYGGSGDEHYLITRTSDGAPQQVQYLDVLNRPLRTITGGYLGNASATDDSVQTTASYNGRGQMISQSEPAFSGVSAITSYTYDLLGRVKRKTAPATSSGLPTQRYTHYQYLGLTTRIWTGNASAAPAITAACDTVSGDTSTLTDSTNICMQRTYASNEWLISTSDAHGNNTRYWYDGQGNPLVIQDSDGNNIHSVFNGLGQRISIDDPNQGLTTMLVNGLGEVISQTNARGQSFSMSYDLIGRMIGREVSQAGQPGIADSWLYDFGVGNGLLAQTARAVDNIQQWRRDYSYDSYYRPSSHTTTLDGNGEAFTVSIYSDPYFVRPYARTYPNGALAVYSRYDQNGYLAEEGTAEQAGMPDDYLYRLEALSPRGQREQISYGNGMTQRWSHHANTGQMQQTWFYEQAGNDLVNIQYQYDRFGNVIQQFDDMTNVTESFGYDHLHRLQSSTRTGLPLVGTVNIEYRYDALGNLMRKSDFSDSYSYGGTGHSCTGSSPAGPNAVTAALTAGGGINYGYDASGNLICDSAGSLTDYDPYNQPSQIIKDGGWSTFAYSSDGQRYRQGGDRDILYIDKLYERHNQSKHQYYIGDYAVITDEGTGRQTNYLHTDRLGSIVAISNELSQINTDEQRGYDPFGKPREGNWSDSDPNDGSNGDLNGYEQTTWGYTGHEHLNGTNLIHMNGRVYDYNLGRFMSVDPVIQFANNSQSFNGYSYIMNNPMSGTDPSGYMAETGCGSSNSGGCGASGADTAGDPNAVGYEVVEESITGSRTRTRKSLKISTPDGSINLNGSGQIIKSTGNARGAIAAIGIVMAYLAGDGNGAASGQTTNTMGGEGGDGEAADTGSRASTPSNDGGITPNTTTQENGAGGCQVPLMCAQNSTALADDSGGTPKRNPNYTNDQIDESLDSVFWTLKEAVRNNATNNDEAARIVAEALVPLGDKFGVEIGANFGCLKSSCYFSSLGTDYNPIGLNKEYDLHTHPTYGDFLSFSKDDIRTHLNSPSLGGYVAATVNNKISILSFDELGAVGSDKYTRNEIIQARGYPFVNGVD